MRDVREEKLSKVKATHQWRATGKEGHTAVGERVPRINGLELRSGKDVRSAQGFSKSEVTCKYDYLGNSFMYSYLVPIDRIRPNKKIIQSTTRCSLLWGRDGTGHRCHVHAPHKMLIERDSDFVKKCQSERASQCVRRPSQKKMKYKSFFNENAFNVVGQNFNFKVFFIRTLFTCILKIFNAPRKSSID